MNCFFIERSYIWLPWTALPNNSLRLIRRPIKSGYFGYFLLIAVFCRNCLITMDTLLQLAYWMRFWTFSIHLSSCRCFFIIDLFGPHNHSFTTLHNIIINKLNFGGLIVLHDITITKQGKQIIFSWFEIIWIHPIVTYTNLEKLQWMPMVMYT